MLFEFIVYFLRFYPIYFIGYAIVLVNKQIKLDDKTGATYYDDYIDEFVTDETKREKNRQEILKQEGFALENGKVSLRIRIANRVMLALSIIAWFTKI